jgi:hypothetical protein
MFLPATHMGWAAGYALACRSATDVDASLFPLFRWMGMDVVIRNHNSDYLVACIELQEEVTTPELELAEELALRRAVSFAGEDGFNKVMIGSDYLSLVQHLLSRQLDRSLVGVVVGDIKILANNFTSFSINYVCRQCNEAAHILALQFLETLPQNVFEVFA